MPDDTLLLPGSLSAAALRDRLREQEDLFFRLVSVEADPAAGENRFGFDSRLDEPEGEEKLLGVHLPAAADEAAQKTARAMFVEFGGEIAADGVLLIGGQPAYVILYRGAEPEWPHAHKAVKPPPTVPLAPAPIPAHAQQVFGSARDGEFGGLPWASARKELMQLEGLAGSTVHTFRDDAGKIVAFLMVTDADIDTDGPGGSRAIDPSWQAETSLRFRGGASCDSRKFPGVVRSVKMLDELGLNMGDLAFLCHKGKVVPCQVYDQGPTRKIGEISLFTARELGGVPPSMSDRAAARGGNFTEELVCLFFPHSSPNGRALANAEIAARARHAFDALTGRIDDETAPVGDGPVMNPIFGGPALASPIIHPREAWGASPARRSSFARRRAEGIVVHNTEDANRSPRATPEEETRTAFALSRRIQHSHISERGWSDVGQHFTISRGGVIMEARLGTLDGALAGEVVQGAHAGSNHHNARWFGIELEGDFRRRLEITAPQRAALVALCAWLCKMGGFPATSIKGHLDVKPGGTDCPGEMLAHLPLLRTEVAAQLARLG